MCGPQMGACACKRKESRRLRELQMQPITLFGSEGQARFRLHFKSQQLYAGLFLNSKFQADMITQVLLFVF